MTLEHVKLLDPSNRVVGVGRHRTTHIKSLKLIVILVASLAASLRAADTVTTNQVGQGVVYKHYHYDNLDGGKQEVYITDTDLNDPGVSIKFPHLTAKRTVSAHAETVQSAAVAINGQFFDSAGSVQFLKVNGSVIYSSRANVHDEQALIDDGLGHTNSLGVALRPRGINSWTNSTWPNILACGVELVKNGIKLADSGYDPNDPFVTVENPRTCVAWTYDNHLLLMCVDGRSVDAHGMSIYELRDDIYSRGSIRHAFSLDSGGSTEMWARGIGICNVPSDGQERPVADAVVVAATALTLPTPPTNLAATVSIINVSLSWSLSSGATSYNLKRSTTNGGPYAIIGNTPLTTFTNTGLAQGATYYYVVSALNSIGESSDSSQVGATTLSVPPPPVHLTATADDSQVFLSWDASPGASTYHVKRSITDGGPYTIVANVTLLGCTNSGLTLGTTYYYVVSALNGDGESTNSSQVSATPLSVPPPPTHLTATAGDSQALLSWDGAPGASSYHVKRSATDGGLYAIVANVNSLGYTNGGLVNGATYYYVVAAANSVGESTNSEQAIVTSRCDIPSPPANLAAMMDNGQIVLDWGAVSGAANYTTYRPTSISGPYSPLITGLTATHYIDTAVVMGTTYFYTITASNSCGVSAASGVASAPLLLAASAVAGTNLALSGWGGVPGQSYYLLGSTNMATPVSQWTQLATNVFGPGGSFSVTITMDAALSQQFFHLTFSVP